MSTSTFWEKGRRYAFPFIAILFSILTLAEGGKRVFHLGHNASSAENIVWPVLYFNFASGFLYLLTAIVAFSNLRLAHRLSLLLCILIASAGIYLLIHGLSGGEFMPKTAVAMGFRFFFWLGFAIWSHRSLKPK